MKKQMKAVMTTLVMVLVAVMVASAQTDKTMPKGEMNMMTMEKSPHHLLMMAHRQSALAFATLLRDTIVDGKFADLEMARNAFAEVKHCLDQMEMLHRTRKSSMKMDPTDKMKSMMAEMKPAMEAEKAAIAEHIAMLESLFTSDAPDAAEVRKHAVELVMTLEKKMMPGKKMAMPAK